MIDTDGYRYCDRCGVLLSKDNNRCGYELCDECNEELERIWKNRKKVRRRDAST